MGIRVYAICPFLFAPAYCAYRLFRTSLAYAPLSSRD